MTALTSLVKKKGVKSQELNLIAKKIWNYLIQKGITLHNSLHNTSQLHKLSIRIGNCIATKIQASGSCVQRHSRKIVGIQVTQVWIFLHDVFSTSFQQICQRIWILNARQQMHFRISGLSGFLPFSLIRRVFLKKAQEDWTTLIPITRNWQSQYWYLELLNMSINNPILLPKKMNLLVDPKINIHPLIKTNIFQLAA